MWILFVAKDRRHPSRHDVGSVLCLNLLEFVREQVRVQMCTKADKPAWVRGTPTLWNEEHNDVFTGHQAVQMLQKMAFASASAQEQKPATKSPRSTAARRVMSPGLQMRPEETASAPPPPRDGEMHAVDGMWESQIDDDATEEISENKKLLAEDLSAFASRTAATAQPTQSQIPTLPPLND